MKKLKSLLLLFAIGFGITVVQCTSQNEKAIVENIEAAQEEDNGENEHNEMIQLSAEEQQEFGVELAVAGPGELMQHLDLTGEIKIDPDQLAHIVPRFPGVVMEVKKKIGDWVKKGEAIAVIESNESLAPYKVRSLIDGTVIEMHMTRGEVIEDAGHAVVVADLSRVWADFAVYQKDLLQIKTGQMVMVSAGPNLENARAKISYISPVVDKVTRTAIARVILPNGDGRWRPGLFVNARVQTNKMKVQVVVPKTALETFENQTVIFLKTKDGFVPQPVTIGRSNLTSVEIKHGLQAGQTYVSKNGFTLKAELQKESFGGGHTH